jgi:putative membrane protein
MLASLIATLVSTVPVVAQTAGTTGAGTTGGAGAGQTTSPSTTPGATSGTTGTSSTDTTRRNQRPTSNTGSGYQSGAAAADVDSTTDINSRNAAGRDRLSWGERRFVTKAADNGQAEVQLAQLAAQRATNPEVRSYAQKLVEDHSKVNSELVSLAGQKNIKVDTDDDKDRSYKRLNKKSGSEFDQEFVEHMIDEHEKDIKMFEKAASDAKDPDLKAFASRHVSHLREHLQQAQSLRQSVMPTGRTDTSSGRSDTSGGRSTPGGTTGTGTDTSTTPSTTTPRTDSGTTSGTTSSPSSSDTNTRRRNN